MHVPFDEVANYPRFHDAAGAIFRIAGSIFDDHGIAILAYGDGLVRVVKSARLPADVLVEGTVIPPDSDITGLLNRASRSGALASDAPLSVDGLVPSLVAVAPIVLHDDRPFGAIVVLANADALWEDGHLGMVSDLATLTAFAVESERRRSHDNLTGLYNRSMFDDHLALEIARSRRNGTWLALLVAGFEFPDASPRRNEAWWLARVSERLQASIRRGDTVARVGPREFALLAPDLRNDDAARRVATAQLELLMDPLPDGDASLSMIPSIGMSLVPSNGFNPRHLFDGAVEAMQHVRANGGCTFALYSDVRLSGLDRR